MEILAVLLLATFIPITTWAIIWTRPPIIPTRRKTENPQREESPRKNLNDDNSNNPLINIQKSDFLRKSLDNPKLKNFVIYILPVILGEIAIDSFKDDMALADGLGPALALWAITGRIQAVPIAWLLLLVVEPALSSQYDGTGTILWITTAAGAAAGIARWARWRFHKSQGQRSTPPWCYDCQKTVTPVRSEFPIGWFAICMAAAVISGALTGWNIVVTLPIIIFAALRLGTKPLCPDCKEHMPTAKIPFDRETFLMAALITICIAGNIGNNVAYNLAQPSEECQGVLDKIQKAGGPNLLIASDPELDRWLDEDPQAWDLYDEAGAACWPD